MSSIIRVFSPLLLLLLILCSCATPGSATGPGYVVTNHYEGILISTNAPGKKRGTACTENIAGLVTSGDATISAAMKDGAITQVSSVDHHYKSILGIYGKMCTIVTGN
jgi:hypothetical protein